MADAAVGWAINKLDIVLTGELNLLASVNREFEDVKEELETIKAFLKDAESRLYQETVDNKIEAWVTHVRQIAFRIEDVIDEYTLHVGNYEERQGCSHKITGIFKMLWARCGIASKIQDIKRRVTEIRQQSNRYSFVSSSEQGSNHKHNLRHDPRIHSLLIEETELVGIEFPRAELIKSLVEGASENVAISVVGMGGLGKTTLAKKVYDSERVTSHFDFKAWITVSQLHNEEDILKTLVRE